MAAFSSSLKNTSRWSTIPSTSRICRAHNPHSPRRQSEIIATPAVSRASSMVWFCGTSTTRPSRGILTLNGSEAKRPLLPKVSNRSCSTGRPLLLPGPLGRLQHADGAADVELAAGRQPGDLGVEIHPAPRPRRRTSAADRRCAPAIRPPAPCRAGSGRHRAPGNRPRSRQGPGPW